MQILFDRIKKHNFSFVFSFLLLGIFFLIPVSHASYNYTPLESVPGFEGTSSDLKGFIESIYQFGIWTVGIAAVLMLTIGGFMYMVSAGNTSKTGIAKGIITDAILGLIIALGAYLILYVINPDLVKITLSMRSLGTGISTGETCNDVCSGKEEGASCPCNGSNGKCESGTCKVVDACTTACSGRAEGADCSCSNLSGKCESGRCKIDVGSGCSAIVSVAQTMRSCCYCNPDNGMKNSCSNPGKCARNGCSGSPAYTDCSGLVMSSYKSAGCRVPGSTAKSMNSLGEAYSGDPSSLKAGDLLASTKHVVICMSDGCGQVIHASNSSPPPRGGVKTNNGSDYYGKSNFRVVHASRFCDSCGS